MSKWRLRFSLASLLSLATVVVLFVGITQTRRRNVFRDANELMADGAYIYLDRELLDKIWLQKPKSAGVSFQQLPTGDFELRGRIYTAEEAIAYGKSLQTRLEQFGVERVYFF
jgi:hypothetical protein